MIEDGRPDELEAGEGVAALGQEHCLWLEGLIREHWSRLVGTTTRYVGNRSAAEDIVQEGFIKMLRSLARDPGKAPTVPWAYKIIRNCATDHLRTTNREREALTELGPRPLPLDPDHAAYHAAVGTLDAMQSKTREAFLLCGLAKYSSREAGLKMGIQASTVRTLHAKAIKALRAAIIDTDNPLGGNDGS